MSGQITRKVGEKLYLEAQIPDYLTNPTVRIFYRLVDGAGVELNSLTEIPLISLGAYQEDTVIMPNEPVVLAKFYVYDATGLVLQTQYGVGADRYMRDDTVAASGGVVIMAEPVEMSIEESAIEGTIVDDSLEVEIVDESSISMEIESETLLGEIEDE